MLERLSWKRLVFELILCCIPAFLLGAFLGHLPWFLLALRYALPWRWFPRKTLDVSRGARLRLALQVLGPIFI